VKAKAKLKDQLKEDHCELCRQIREACAADRLQPQNCKLCGNLGYLGGIDSLVTICPECPKGFRLKLWIAHEKRDGHCVLEIAA